MFKRKIPEPTHQIDERLAKDLRGLRFDSICGGLQLFTESLLCRWVSACIEHTGVHNVVAAGGVFMNVKANKALLELDGVESFEAFPSCGDETLGIGACLLTNAQRGIRSTRIPHYYLGDTFSDEDVERELAHHDFSISKPASMPETAAKLLEAGHPVARCAGPMEFGARALGNRSILANPKNPDVVRVINRMIKKRDFWMPFAPVVRRDRVDSYFSNPKGARSPFMMMTFDSKDNYTELLAAVHNADLTARAQIVEPGQNDELEAILDAFESRTGQSVLLNTSFNLHGFPIVCGPKEALDVFAQTGLEFMVLGSYLVSKRPVEQVLAA